MKDHSRETYNQAATEKELRAIFWIRVGECALIVALFAAMGAVVWGLAA